LFFCNLKDTRGSKRLEVGKHHGGLHREKEDLIIILTESMHRYSMGRAVTLCPTHLSISPVPALAFLQLCGKPGQGTDLSENFSHLPLFPSPPIWVSSAGSNP